MTKIRISKVSDLATARACATLNIDFIGLNLTHGTPNAISPIKVNDYTQWLSGIEVVAQVHHLDEEKALKFMSLLNLQHAEILGDNYSNGSEKLWYLNPKSQINCGKIVSEKTGLSGFLQINNLADLDDLPTVGEIDLPINIFEKNGEMDWQLAEDVINQLKA